MMDTIIGEYVLFDKKLESPRSFVNQYNSSDYTLYEVIRVCNGILLFLDDHIDRMYTGIRLLGQECSWNVNETKSDLLKMIVANGKREGNIKLLFRCTQNKAVFAAYYIPHLYPEEILYKQGIKLSTFHAERSDPQIKQLSKAEHLRIQIDELRQKTDAYEIVLVNSEGNITEGSKSNFFLVRDNFIFSAPEKEILAGVTRKYVISIAQKEGIEVIKREIKRDKLWMFSAAFICGTSPKILPVREIDNIQFNPKNSIIELISREYNSIIEKYINNNKD